MRLAAPATELARRIFYFTEGDSDKEVLICTTLLPSVVAVSLSLCERGETGKRSQLGIGLRTGLRVQIPPLAFNKTLSL
jgi:hypothetical protein